MRPRFRCLLLSASLLAVPGIALATIRPTPVRLHVDGPAPVFRPGEPATLRFEMLAREAVTVSQLTIESGSLAKPFARSAAPLSVLPSAPAKFELSLLPGERPEPLRIRYMVDGVEQVETIDLTSRMESVLDKRSRLVEVADARPKPPSAALLAQADSVSRARKAAGGSGTLIFFSGRLVYTRPGGDTLQTQDVGAFGVRVSLMDEDTGPDDELASTFTDYDGDFYYWAYWDQIVDGDPELYLHFETDHPWVVVQEGFWDIEYSWSTSTRASSTADLHVGTFRPADLSTHPAMHIAANIAKCHAWYQDKAGYVVPSVDVKWPDGSNAFFDPLFEQIHISHAREWEESVHSHEYGHFFVYTFAGNHSPQYCNGLCDTDGCGHCIWCEEGTNEAFSEGWPDWISAVQTRDFRSLSGYTAVHQYDFESIRGCGATGTFTDASKTEGNFAAVLWDLYDSGSGTDDTDPNGFGWRDRLGLGFDEILYTLDVGEPKNSHEFLANFAYYFPQYRSATWEAAMNSRWDIDVFPPGPVTSLTSSSHPQGASTPNLNVTLSWTPPAADDWSGVKGYSIAFGASPTAPDAVLEVGVATSWTSGDLAPGTYYATICAVDRSNRISATYPTYGPFVVQQPTPVDLAPYTAAGWARPLVARPTADATASSVPNPVVQLTGNTAATYFNVSGRNQGQSAHVGFIGVRTRIFADAVGFHTSGYVHPDAPGATFNHVNRAGTIRGGRHMIGTILDGFNEWWESNESNNYWSHAWVWSPLTLAPNTAVRRLAGPPNPTGSWSGVVDGSPTYYNCDGFRFSSSGAWNAVWVAADADTDDYDVRLHPASSSPNTGYDTVWGWGTAPEGCIDAVVVNQRTQGVQNYDIGVINDLDPEQDFAHQSPFVLKHVTSTSFPFPSTLDVTFPDSEYVVLKEIYIASPTQVTVSVQADPADGPVRVVWLDRTTSFGTLTGLNWTWPSGSVTLEQFAPLAGYYCVALMRDPRDGRGARTCRLGIGITPCDLSWYFHPGWSAPVIPRPSSDGTLSSVPLPDTLHGGIATTYVNVGWRNESPSAVPQPFSWNVRVDGVTALAMTGAALGANATGMLVGPASPPLAVRGGRHMLGAVWNADSLFSERSRRNNAWAEQWVWSPLSLALGNGVTAAEPPDPVGGFADYTGTAPLYFNCAGFRTTFGSSTGLWGCVGLIPSDSTNSDLRLHDPLPGTRDAFGAALGYSSWGRYDSDYLILRHDGPRVIDASVVRGDDGPGGEFDIGAEGATALATLPLATPDLLMGTNSIARVHPVLLPAGDIRVRIVNVSGNVDWGVSVHDDSSACQGKSEAKAAEWLAAPGANEELIFHVDAPDTFAITVWKRGAGDRGKFGVYRLQANAITLDAPPPAAPLATRLAPAWPTPFRDRTALSFELSARGEAKLEIFDLRGARVRTLARGVREAGRHTFEWPGDDESGQRLAPGVYLVRLEAGRIRQQQKLVKIE